MKFEDIINNYLTEQDALQQQSNVNVTELFAQISQAINTSPGIRPEEKQRYISDIERIATEVSRTLKDTGAPSPTNNPVQVTQGAPQGFKSAGPETMA